MEPEKTSVYNYSKLLGRMKEKGITQETLAKGIGVNPATLNTWLNNKGEFSQRFILKTCAFLDIPINQIPYYFFCSATLEKQSNAS